MTTVHYPGRPLVVDYWRLALRACVGPSRRQISSKIGLAFFRPRAGLLARVNPRLETQGFVQILVLERRAHALAFTRTRAMRFGSLPPSPGGVGHLLDDRLGRALSQAKEIRDA